MCGMGKVNGIKNNKNIMPIFITSLENRASQSAFALRVCVKGVNGEGIYEYYINFIVSAIFGLSRTQSHLTLDLLWRFHYVAVTLLASNQR